MQAKDYKIILFYKAPKQSLVIYIRFSFFLFYYGKGNVKLRTMDS